jgi:hypothetical protein
MFNKQTNFAARNSFNTCSTDLLPNAIRVERALARILKIHVIVSF